MAPFRALGAASAAAAVAAAAVAAAATAVAATPTPTPPSAAAATVEAATAAGVAYFARRCAEQRPLLVGLRNAIGRGDLAAARTAYIASRPPYEEIETLANVPVVTPLDTQTSALPPMNPAKRSVVDLFERNRCSLGYADLKAAIESLDMRERQAVARAVAEMTEKGEIADDELRERARLRIGDRCS